jgi:hypothetical protein
MAKLDKLAKDCAKQIMVRGATLSARTFFGGRGFQPRSSRLESRSHRK